MAGAKAWHSRPTPMAQGASGHGHRYFGHPVGGVRPPSNDGDSPILPELLDQIPEGEGIGTVTADSACDRGIAENQS